MQTTLREPARTAAAALPQARETPRPSKGRMRRLVVLCLGIAVAVGGGRARGAVTFPLEASPSGRYLVDGAGVPFFMFGDAAQSGDAAISYSQWQSYIDKRVSQGFNTVNVNLAEHLYSQNPPKDTSGNLPWTTKMGGGAYTGLSDTPDFSSGNDVYWAGLEQKVAYAQSKGVFVSLALYLGFGGTGGEGWIDELDANTTTTCTGFGTYLANGHGSFGGFKKYPNVMWVWGADNYLSGGSTGSTNLHVIAAAIKAAGSTQLMSGDWGHGILATDQADFKTYMDLESVYSYGQPEIVANSRGGYSYVPSSTGGDGRALPALPTFMKETGYENENHSPADVRGFQWWSMLSGCTAGYWFGNRDTWPFADPAGGYDPPLFAPHGEWTDAVGVTGGSGSTGTQDMARFSTLWRSLSWWKLVPSGGSAPFIGRTLVAGGNDASAGGAVAAAQASDGSLLVAYTPSTSFSVDLRSMTSGQIRARWWDPTSGAFSTIGTSDNSQSAYSVTTPGTNSAGDSDWLLVLDVAASGGVTILPSSTSVPPKGTTTFTASGGSGTGYVWTLSANPSGGSISAAGVYRAGSTGSVTDVVRVTDSANNFATASVAVTAGVAIVPAAVTLAPKGTVTFTASGGSGTGYVWSLAASPSGGSISAAGLYTAGATDGVSDTVAVTDSLGNGATATVAVSAGSPAGTPVGTKVTSACGCGRGGDSAVSLGLALLALAWIPRRRTRRRTPPGTEV